MKIGKLIEKAENNKSFHFLTVSLYSRLIDGTYTEKDISEATFLACEMYKAKNELKKAEKMRW